MLARLPLGVIGGLTMAMLAGGCSTVSDIVGLEHAGVQPDGSYKLTEAEQASDCRGLVERIEINLAAMEKLQTRIPVEQEALPGTMVAVFEQISGSPDGGSKSARLYRESEVRARTLNETLRGKDCHRIDIDARIRSWEQQPNPPARQGA